ncbi:unnamed protein product [Effrenium voratum]|uniref:Uncharacterized protein n=1 Tax=Effrenium voratum TaxID=2562239 RepID=A0AA36JNP7_9DINO|nr:unnamed protein product [Effrenium voratum]CAJ1408421.1 unnamed protein product [Effrenium voratum]CAJ1442797.1 unnamed protein product [Effrenium voratum]
MQAGGARNARQQRQPARPQAMPNRVVLPARQRLLPMPTFGRQPVQVVTGQVVDVGPDMEGVVQGRIERGPWHESDLEIPHDLRLERGNTGLLATKYKNLGRTLLLNSLIIIVLYFVTSAGYFYFSKEVPRTCNVKLGSSFVWLGVCQAALGLTMTCFLGVAHHMLWALYHGEIAERYRLQCREEEAESEESDYESQASRARWCLVIPRLIHSFMTVLSILIWIHGVYLAMLARDEVCGRSVEVFWLLAFITFITTCYSSVDSSGRSAVSL